MEKNPQIPAAIAAVPSLAVPAKPPGSAGTFEQRRDAYADKFSGWLKNLNQHDFLQARKLLDQMMHLYAKHTMKIHSPPARETTNDNVSGSPSPGPSGPVLPGDEPGAA